MISFLSSALNTALPATTTSHPAFLQASIVLKLSAPPKASINLTALSSRDWLVAGCAVADSSVFSVRPMVFKLNAWIAKRKTA